MASFGYITIGSSGWSDFGNVLMGYHAAPINGDGVIDNIQAYIRNVGGANYNVKCAVYSYNGAGDAGSPIANGESDVVSLAPDAGSWVTFTFSTNPTVTNGVEYFILIWGAQGGGLIHIAYDAGGAAGIGLFKSVAYGAWPTPLAGETSSTAQRSIYVNYTPSTPSDNRKRCSSLLCGL